MVCAGAVDGYSWMMERVELKRHWSWL